MKQKGAQMLRPLPAPSHDAAGGSSGGFFFSHGLGTAGGIRPATKAHWASVRSVLYGFRVWQVAFCSDMIFSPRVITLNSL